MSTTWGRPSVTLFTRRTGRPAASITLAVPEVATTSKPSSIRSRATWTTIGLSSSRTLMNTVPELGRTSLAPIWALAKASPKVSPTPITSPVDFISGPRIGSTPGNLANGNTASLTLKYGGMISSV
ncbi:hypothetical protein D9M71_405710 [compost metagenome]